MTPPESHYTDPLTAMSTAFAAVKPIYWGVVSLLILGYGAAQFANRIEVIEEDVQTIKLILCADASAAADTYCRRTGR